MSKINVEIETGLLDLLERASKILRRKCVMCSGQSVNPEKLGTMLLDSISEACRISILEQKQGGDSE